MSYSLVVFKGVHDHVGRGPVQPDSRRQAWAVLGGEGFPWAEFDPYTGLRRRVECGRVANRGKSLVGTGTPGIVKSTVRQRTCRTREE
jgi:hypothetical protein